MLIMEHNAGAHARLWDPIARQKMRSGQICNSCRSPLPPPHTPECKRCALCAGSHHVRMTFFRSSCLALPFLLRALAAASEAPHLPGGGQRQLRPPARQWVDRGRYQGSAQALHLKIGRGGLILRLSDEQFLAIAEGPPPAPGGVQDPSRGGYSVRVGILAKPALIRRVRIALGRAGESLGKVVRHPFWRPDCQELDLITICGRSPIAGSAAFTFFGEEL